MSKLHELAALGQSIWLDYVRRAFTRSGELQALVEQGLRGVTSNPTIFEAAIARSDDYHPALQELLPRVGPTQELYEALVIEDIREAADLLRPVYDATDGGDGFVSLEVNPGLAHDAEGTVSEARRLFSTLDRPNVMIKVPATAAGQPAIEALIAAGVNVNVTLIFALDHYRAVTEAYIAGLERRAAAGGALAGIASVASFFLSRIDTAVDRILEESAQGLGVGEPQVAAPRIERLRALQGQAAIASARLAYACFQETFQGKRWDRLASQGARVQRPLWASTGTKNPAYSDILYVDTLIAPHTVNTLPPATLNAFLDHGTVALTLEEGMQEAGERMAELAEAGVDMEVVTTRLQEEGVAAFARSFDSLLGALARIQDGWRGPRPEGAAPRNP
jgi:transaldolase